MKLKAIAIWGGPDYTAAPSHLKVYVVTPRESYRLPSSISWINREDVDFDVVEGMEPVQEWELVEESPDHDVIEYPTRYMRWMW